jgi:hypothetical protein
MPRCQGVAGLHQLTKHRGASSGWVSAVVGGSAAMRHRDDRSLTKVGDQLEKYAHETAPEAGGNLPVHRPGDAGHQEQYK